MPKTLIARINGRVVARYLLGSGEPLHVQAVANMTYEVFDNDTGALARDLIVKKEGQNLILEFDEQTQAVIDNFFDSSLQVSYLTEDGLIDDSDFAEADQADIPPAPPPTGAEAGAAAATSTGSSLPTVGLGAAGAGAGIIIGAITNNDTDKTSNDSEGNVDTTSPTATITLSNDNLSFGETATVTITFSEAVTNFDLNDLSADNGTLTGLTTEDNITWTATFTPTTPLIDTTNNISLSATYTDEAGNIGTAATSDNYEIDTATINVVFDLINGTSTNIQGRSFEVGYDYQIFIQVDSGNSAIALLGGNEWINATNLGVGDSITLVGNGAVIEGVTAQNVTGLFQGAFTVIWNTSPAGTGAATMTRAGGFVRFWRGGSGTVALFSDTIPDLNNITFSPPLTLTTLP